MEEVSAMILRHAAMLIGEKGSYIGIREMRKHAGWYVAGLRHASMFRRQINEVKSLDELQELLQHMKEA